MDSIVEERAPQLPQWDKALVVYCGTLRSTLASSSVVCLKRDMDCTAGRPQMWRLSWFSASASPPLARGTRVTNGDGGGVQQQALWIRMGSQYQLDFPILEA
jgi:hypothetical protein